MTPSQLLATEVPGPLVVVRLKGAIDVENEENKICNMPEEAGRYGAIVFLHGENGLGNGDHSRP